MCFFFFFFTIKRFFYYKWKKVEYLWGEMWRNHNKDFSFDQTEWTFDRIDHLLKNMISDQPRPPKKGGERDSNG